MRDEPSSCPHCPRLQIHPSSLIPHPSYYDSRPMLMKPRPLPRSGHVAVLAGSSPSELPRIEEGVRHLEEYGLRVTLAENIGHRYGG